MGKGKYLALTIILTIALTSLVQATTDVTVKTDVPFYDIAIRMINYANEDVIGSTYLKTDATGLASGTLSTGADTDLIKITILIYRDGVIYKQYDNYGTFRLSSPVNIDLREKKDSDNNSTNSTITNNSTTNSTTPTNETNSTTNLQQTKSSTTGNVISPSVVSNSLSNLWIYIVAGLVIVGAVGFAGFKYVQQRGTMSGLAKYDKAKGPIEEKPLFPPTFQPVSEKMNSMASEQELQKAKDRIRNLERELSMARNADKIRETERRIEEDKRKLDRLRKGENA